jgi:hypothetical protein
MPRRSPARWRRSWPRTSSLRLRTRPAAPLLLRCRRSGGARRSRVPPDGCRSLARSFRQATGASSEQKPPKALLRFPPGGHKHPGDAYVRVGGGEPAVSGVLHAGTCDRDASAGLRRRACVGGAASAGLRAAPAPGPYVGRFSDGERSASAAGTPFSSAPGPEPDSSARGCPGSRAPLAGAPSPTAPSAPPADDA